MHLESQAVMVVCFFIWLPSCTPHQVIATQRHENVLTLSCRDRDSQDIQHPIFYFNNSQRDLRSILPQNQYLEKQNGLTFTITRELEGNYSCGPSISKEAPLKLVAYPNGRSISSKHITAVAGTDAVLPPLVPPGALIQQYFIDWYNATSPATLARIQGPRNQVPLFEPHTRYSVDSNTLSLTIQSVKFEDRGSYLGVVGVMDPAGQPFTYKQTMIKNITLEVYVPPTFIEYPLDQEISNNSTILTCTVKGYPKPTITWYHNGRIITTGQSKYMIKQKVITEAPYTVKTDLTIMDLGSHDSGNVTCFAVVAPAKRKPFKMQKTSQLSVLGELAEVTTFITFAKAVILRVNLIKPLAARVKLLIQYTDIHSGKESTLITTTQYSETNEITYFDETVPFEQFTLAVALVAESAVSPLHHDPVQHDLSCPTELLNYLHYYVLPCTLSLSLLIIAVFVVILFCTCYCYKYSKSRARCNSESKLTNV